MEMDKYIGRWLDDRYEILDVLGTGGMAVVYKARCHRLNRLVAIKILKAEYTKDEEFRSRFHAESRAVAMLSHPNIVSVYDVSTTDESDYIVMELIDGITLKQYVEKKGILNWKETLHFAIQIAKALEHAHSRGIIHRDIKPHNVMVLKNGSVKVTDFGIARVMSESNTLTKEALGSVHYLSPEQAKGGRVDNRSDLYSLGVVMYEMATGRLPYDGDTPVAVAIQHINGKATLPTAINANIPGGLEQIIVRAMSLAPQDRFPSAAAMLTDLDEFRKNPTILFDYNNPNTDMDAATRLQPAKREGETVPKPAPARQPVRNAPSGAPVRRKAPANRSGRMREVIVEEKEERSQITTVAIIACVVLALLAIIALGIVLINNLSSDEIIHAPNLIGQVFDERMDYGDVYVEITKKQYSDEYAKGEIIDQSPKPNKRMNKGETVYVVVSLGPQPEEKVMEDLTQVPEEQAKAFLNDLNIGLKILTKMEISSTVEKGCVIRTNPIEGELLEKGQTVVLWISSGVQTVMSDLPKVEGQQQQAAINALEASGFFNVDIVEIESEVPAGTVLTQTPYPQEGVKYDVNTPITLIVSKGPANTEEPPVEETGPFRERTVDIYLPATVMEDCTLTIWRGDRLVEERPVYAGTVYVEMKLWGYGNMTFTAMLSDTANTIWTFDYDFGVVEPEQ